MEKLKELKLGKDLVGNKDAQTLAHDLLGKIIHCADGDYLITVTEAYPANDSYSYIYRATHNEDGTKKSEKEIKKDSKAYKILTDKNMVDKFFLYGGMLHLACKANKVESENARVELDNVLIRGAIKIEDNKLIIDENNVNMNFGQGRPTTLVKALGIHDDNDENLFLLCDRLLSVNEITESKRIGLGDQDNLDANAKYRFFISAFNYYTEENHCKGTT